MMAQEGTGGQEGGNVGPLLSSSLFLPLPPSSPFLSFLFLSSPLLPLLSYPLLNVMLTQAEPKCGRIAPRGPH